MTLLKMPQEAIPPKEEWSTERKQHPDLGEDGEGYQVHGFLSLTEEALLVTAAVSIALGTDAAVVAGMVLEAVTLGVGMLRVTPTASQICCAKARVTKERGDRQRRTCVLRGLGSKRGGEGELTLLVGSGADRFDQVVQRGHEFGVAADAGEVGFRAARGGDAGFRCGLLEVMSVSWCFEEKGVF